MPHGKFFYIKSKMNGLVLDIEGGDYNEGASLITWEKKDDEPDNQLWYEERTTDTIRSKLNNLCITATDDGLKMQEYDEHNDDQQWRFADDGMIRNRNNHSRVFDIIEANEDPGAKIGAWEENDQDNQKWDMERVEARYFMIKSSLNGLCVDIEGQNRDEGAKVIVWEETGGDNQFWYEDEEGIIRSKMNDFAICANNEDCAKMECCDSNREDHQWHRVGDMICLRASRGHTVLDIKGGSDENGAEVIAWERTGGDNQKWHYHYE